MTTKSEICPRCKGHGGYNLTRGKDLLNYALCPECNGTGTKQEGTMTDNANHDDIKGCELPDCRHMDILKSAIEPGQGMMFEEAGDRQGKIESESGYCEWAFEDDYVHIYNLFVYPKSRRRGKARLILQNAIDAIRATGYNGEIKIVVDPQDDFINVIRLRSFYFQYLVNRCV